MGRTAEPTDTVTAMWPAKTSERPVVTRGPAVLGQADQPRTMGGGAKAERAACSSVNILGVDVTTASLPEVAREVAAWATDARPESGPRYVCATSVHGLIEAARDPVFRRILNGAARVTPDGMPLVWFGKLRGRSGMTRVYGPTLMKEVCRLTADGPVRHFFYGGVPGVADELARRLQREFPGLQVAGTCSPPYRSLSHAELTESAQRINDSGTDIVWVGLSTPKQERWIYAVHDRLRVRVVLSVGAAFDFHTGRVRQAPRWMQRAGLEWAFRLSQEPRRLWRRYAYNNPVFLWLALSQLTGLRKFTNSNQAE